MIKGWPHCLLSQAVTSHTITILLPFTGKLHSTAVMEGAVDWEDAMVQQRDTLHSR